MIPKVHFLLSWAMRVTSASLQAAARRRPTEAEVVYWEDLRRNPANGYALFGLKQSLEAQDKRGDLAEVERRLAAAWSEADVTLTSSRY